LNPKSLVSTTNKLQQFVSEVERLECFTLRQRDVAVIVERGGSALLALSWSARAGLFHAWKATHEATYPSHRESCDIVDGDREHLARLILNSRGRSRSFGKGGKASRPLGLCDAATGQGKARPRGRFSAAQINRRLDQHPSLNSTTGRRKGVAAFQTWPLSVVGIVPLGLAERIVTRLLERRRSH
jgi:hypothetical protein